MTTATTPQRPRALHRTTVLPCEAASASAARTWARHRLAAQEVPERIVGDAVQLLSELIANAAQWTGCRRIGIRLQIADRRLRFDVEDGSRSLPVHLPAGEDDENGRGLTLVDALSDRWGAHVLPLGKTVWFELTLPACATTRRDATAAAGDAG